MTERPEGGEWFGPNPFEGQGGASADGFVLSADGSAYDHNLQKSYSREELRVLVVHLEEVSTQNARMFSAEAKARKSKAPNFDWDLADKYPYYDEDYVLLLQVGQTGGPEGKQIRWRKPVKRVQFKNAHPDSDFKKSDWIYNAKDVRRVLFQLPVIMKVNRVFFCESEEIAEALNDWLVSQKKHYQNVATATLGGMGDAYVTDFGSTLMGKEVIILPNNDPCGRRYGGYLFSLCSPSAASVQIHELPGLPEKGNVADYLEAHAKSGERPTELLQLIDAADWIPPDPDLEAPRTGSFANG